MRIDPASTSCSAVFGVNLQQSLIILPGRRAAVRLEMRATSEILIDEAEVGVRSSSGLFIKTVREKVLLSDKREIQQTKHIFLHIPSFKAD